MVNIILISHGEFCEGLLKSLIMVTGDDYGIKTLALYPGMTADKYREKLDQIILENENSEGTLILADIVFGTPFQSAAYMSKTHKIGLVSGMNMPMLVAVASERTESSTLKDLIEIATNPDYHGIQGTLFEKGETKRRGKLSINKD
jgi:PTS system mannose-specific IIA component